MGRGIWGCKEDKVGKGSWFKYDLGIIDQESHNTQGITRISKWRAQLGAMLTSELL